MLDDYFRGEIKRSQKGWRAVVCAAMKRGIPVPAFSTALAFYDQYRAAVLPANLLQARISNKTKDRQPLGKLVGF